MDKEIEKQILENQLVMMRSMAQQGFMMDITLNRAISLTVEILEEIRS